MPRMFHTQRAKFHAYFYVAVVSHNNYDMQDEKEFIELESREMSLIFVIVNLQKVA